MAEPRDSWLARQRHRAGIAVRDASRLVSLAARTAHTALFENAPRPGLAVLAGPAGVRDGEPSRYVIRVCNPTTRPASVRLIADGTCDARRTARFHLEHSIEVAPSGAATYRLSTSWDGHAALVEEPSDVDEIAADAVVDHGSEGTGYQVQVRLVHDDAVVDHLQVRCPRLA
jgi:hypothetical protein